MLRSLHIRNYVLIDSLDVSFPEGLAIITGQTGAGKSILLGALSLLTGAKGDASLVSAGAESCVVEGEFDNADESLRALLEENGVEWTEGGSLLIRRMLYSTGRSRSFVNDCPVSLPVLEKCAELLIDIHSQHNKLILSDKRYQLRVLDLFAGNSEELRKCGGLWRELQDLRSRKAKAEEELAALKRDYDYNQARFTQLDEAKLRDGELQELDEEQKRLSNAEEIKSSLEAALASFEIGEEKSLDSALRETSKLLAKISAFIPSLEELSERIESSRIELGDVRDTIEKEAEKIDVSGERLQQVEERMGLIYSLFQKFGCRTEAELILQREEYSARLFDSSVLENELEELNAGIAECSAAYSKESKILHDSRLETAPKLADAILSNLKFLELERAAFEVRLTVAEAGPMGADSVIFAFSSTGKALEDVAKCASGGEVSRIMLSLKAQMARFTGMTTMIFDEIDTGVSGSAADAMGRMICDMGRDMQVLAISHLPQVAAKGNAHFVVEKFDDTTSIRRVEGEERIMEIARLLSGERITPEAIANAKALLG